MPVIDPFWREWRELGAARRLARAVVYAGSGPLLNPDAGSTPENRVEAVCDAVERCFDALARPPGMDEAPVRRSLRGRVSHLARAGGRADREGRDKLLSDAAALWGDAVRKRRLRERLKDRAHLFPGPGGAAKFQRVVKDALWEAEPDGMVFTAQRRRKWDGLREVSLEILPSREQDGDRCTLAHFKAVAERVKTTRTHDNNLPRKPEAVGEMFYLFCPCCVGVPDPTAGGYGGRVRRRAADIAEGAPDAPEEDGETPDDSPDDGPERGWRGIPEDRVVALLSALKAEIAALPLPDQMVLAHSFGDLAFASRAAKRAYPALDAGAIMSRDRTAAALGITRQDLCRERRRVDDWFSDVGHKLQRDLLPDGGAE